MSSVKMISKIEPWPIDALIPYDKNPKLHPPEQIEQMAASIIEFGFNNPILVDLDKGIVAGHGRLLAARKLKLDLVPVVVLDHLNPAQLKAFMLVENKIGEFGWNDTLLEQELASLEAEGMVMSLFGFEDTDADFNEPISDGVSGNTQTDTTYNEADTLATIGEYRFPIERARYLSWLEQIKQSVGFDKKAVIAEIIKRLAI